MELDELFDKYKTMDREGKELLEKIAKEAQRLCMRAIYWDRERSFYKNISEDEAISVFDENFMTWLERSLEGKSKTLSGCLNFYFPKRLIGYLRTKRKLPTTLTDTIKNPEYKHTDFIDNVLKDGDSVPDPNARMDARNIVKLLLGNFENLPRFERDALILNSSGFSHSEIAQYFDVDKQKVNKKKYQARERLRKLLGGEQE